MPGCRTEVLWSGRRANMPRSGRRTEISGSGMRAGMPVPAARKRQNDSYQQNGDYMPHGILLVVKTLTAQRMHVKSVRRAPVMRRAPVHHQRHVQTHASVFQIAHERGKTFPRLLPVLFRHFQ